MVAFIIDNVLRSLELLKSAVRHTLSDDSFDIKSPLAQASKKDAELLLAWLEKSENEEKIELTLKSIVQQLRRAFHSTVKAVQTKREMWGQYHSIRTSDPFVRSWVLLFKETGLKALPTLYQHLTNLMFKEMIKVHFPVTEVQSSSASCEVTTTVKYEEANAIRYVAGYVCRAVREKIKSGTSPLKQQLLLSMWELLEDVDIDSSESEGEGGEASSSDWVNAVDRGGLLHVTDDTYMVFTYIEAVVQRNLTLSNVKTITDGKQKELLDKVLTDEEVQFQWCMVSTDMSEEVGAELSRRLAIMRITIRGYSFSKCYVEMYKQRQKKITGRSKGLRKELFTSKVQ